MNWSMSNTFIELMWISMHFVKVTKLLYWFNMTVSKTNIQLSIYIWSNSFKTKVSESIIKM